MNRVRIVRGTGTGPTRTASYDAALAAANVHQYNLVGVSSILPEEARVQVPGTAPDLGPAGRLLWVVEARATANGPVTAGLAWAKPPDRPGIVYEASDPEGDEDRVVKQLERGLEAGLELRSISRDAADDGLMLASADPDADPDGYVTAVVLAIYGDGRPIF